MKTGILVASFGTTYQETRKKNIEAVELEIQKRYPEAVCYRGFSSKTVRRILKERDGLDVMDIWEALEQMKEDGITHAYVQLTHMIDGIESGRIKEAVSGYRSMFEAIEIGAPLLTDEADYEKVVKVLWESLCPGGEGKILILMGHGTSHEANEAYGRLEQTFRRMGHPDVYVATVEGIPSIEDVIARMSQEQRIQQKKQVILTPFMLVAGDHAIHDMAGEDEGSYLSMVTKAGYQAEAILKGLGEYKEIREIYLAHLDKVINCTNCTEF